jgi:hypothetical protein
MSISGSEAAMKRPAICPTCHTYLPLPDPRVVILVAMLIESAVRESPSTTAHWRKNR